MAFCSLYGIIVTLVKRNVTFWATRLVALHVFLNKKCEQMLMRRATASVSFHTQVVLVYLQ